MDEKLKLIVDYFGKDRFKFDEPLKNYTALGVGGPARLFFIAFSANELMKIVNTCRQLGVPYFLFGTGSKSMISDNGYNGVAIKNRTKNIQTVSVKGKVTKSGIGVEEAMVEVESGVSVNKLVDYLESQGLETTDFLDVSGSIGGSLFLSCFLQNHLKSIKVLDQESEITQIDIDMLDRKKHIIISAVFKIKAKKL